MRRHDGYLYGYALVALGLLCVEGCGFERPRLLTDVDAGGDAGGERAGSAAKGGGASARGGTSGAGADGRGAEAGSNGSGGDSSSAGAAGDGSCPDFTADLCMTLSWPAAIVPYERDSTVGQNLWDAVEEAMGMWSGTPTAAAKLEFIAETDTPRLRPLLRFTLDSGCGVVGRSADELSFALGSCSGARDIGREIGVALGVPRTHQRSDRDRYLELAPRNAFDCEKGQFYEKCPRFSELGRFSTQDLMFVPPSYPAPGLDCELAPAGDYLYRSKGEELPHSETVNCGVTSSGYGLHRRALTELYATTLGWSPFRLVGPDRDANRPVENGLPLDGVSEWEASVLRWEGGGTTIFAWLSPWNADQTSVGPSELWRTDDDGHGWGEWMEDPRVPSADSAVILPRDGRTADFFVLESESGIVHAAVDDTSEPDWTLLQEQPEERDEQALRVSALTGTRDEAGTIFLYSASSDALLFNSELRVAQMSGATLSAWETLPDTPGVLRLAAAVANGEQCLVALRATGEVSYVQRNARGWSEWFTLLGPEASIVDVAIGSTSLISNPIPRLYVLAATFDQVLQISCEEQCDKPGSWSSPLVVGGSPEPGGIVGVSLFPSVLPLSLAPSDEPLELLIRVFDPELNASKIWHKRWRFPAKPSE
ncbi:MAG TPA: M12 family metallopeptidase [Polyangiaceae bacterium]|nr:M12 family metallopeptidase [Polyangiaceae bacterium]